MFLAVTGSFTLFGLMFGMQGMYRAVVDTERMDRLWVSARFPNASMNGIPLAVEEQIARIEGVRAIGSNKGWGAYYRDPKYGVGLNGFTEGMRDAWPELPLTRAQWNRLFATQNGVYVTRAGAKSMNVKEGDTLSLGMDPRQGGATHVDLLVLGVMDDVPRWSERALIVNFRLVDSLRSPDQRGLIWESRVVVDAEHAMEVAQRIDRYFATSGIPTTSTPAKVSALRYANAGFPITTITWSVSIVGMFVVLLLVGNGIADSVQERTAELAILNTLGFSYGRIRALVFAEALIPCLVGAIVGTTLAPLLAAVPRRLLPPGTGADPDPTVWITAVGWAAACAVLIAIAGAAIPMLRLARLNVVDALAGR